MEQAWAAEGTEQVDHAAADLSEAQRPEAMLSFWVEQGLTHAASAKLLDEIRGRGRSYTMGQLSAKVQRWQRVLPDADIGTMTAKDPVSKSPSCYCSTGFQLMNICLT